MLDPITELVTSKSPVLSNPKANKNGSIPKQRPLMEEAELQAAQPC
jgi:hypothetical protein